jgi:hypothetical protein
MVHRVTYGTHADPMEVFMRYRLSLVVSFALLGVALGYASAQQHDESKQADQSARAF